MASYLFPQVFHHPVSSACKYLARANSGCRAVRLGVRIPKLLVHSWAKTHREEQPRIRPDEIPTVPITRRAGFIRRLNVGLTRACGRQASPKTTSAWLLLRERIDPLGPSSRGTSHC